VRPAPGASGPGVPLRDVPLLRGRLHQACAVLAVPAAVSIARLGATPAARRAGAGYGASLVTVFTVSAAYHRGRWSPPTRRLLKRLDHVAIYAFSATSYLPLATVLPRRARVPFLAFAGTAAAVGSAVKVARVDAAGGVADVLYVVTGWSGLLVLPLLVGRLTAAQWALLLGGGVVTTAGAAVLVRRWPDPVPDVFGYHELGHLVILGGTVLHYLLDRSLLESA
jgi:hemolysin III